MNALSDDVPAGCAARTQASRKIEFQFRGEADALRVLRDGLEAAGVFVQVDGEYKNDVWKTEGIVIGALMVRLAPDDAEDITVYNGAGELCLGQKAGADV